MILKQSPDMYHQSVISGVACHHDQYITTAGYDNKVVVQLGLLAVHFAQPRPVLARS
ncbi:MULTISPECIES: hypothetical protein [unclassified Undibacterium]|uniref:hypothetical protein n=1 Tax=unclassified Undibacterium TaxID=2630295 RepID=UPI002AC8D3CB|nr:MULTISPECIES: hypothetical protein [unclassified Undibacterium]MEB0214228.1 hypothetical protein [Undibacterium sp. 5I2]WPX41810.1 hypothetical protein RHM61_10295 [Undibacterium sp. CCC3.4]